MAMVTRLVRIPYNALTCLDGQSASKNTLVSSRELMSSYRRGNVGRWLRQPFDERSPQKSSVEVSRHRHSMSAQRGLFHAV